MVQSSFWQIFVVVTSVTAGALAPAGQVESTAVSEEKVPFVPSEWRVVDAMLRLADVTSNDVVMDLGCGDGRIVIAAAKIYGARGIGVERDLDLIALGRTNAHRAGVSDRVQFRQDDLFETNLDSATVLTIYLLEKANLRLRPRLLAELTPGTRVISNTFDLGDWKPDRSLEVDMFLYSTPIHRWVVPADFRGRWQWRSPHLGEQHLYTCDLQQEYQRIQTRITHNGEPVAVRSAVMSGDRIAVVLQERRGTETIQVRLTGQLKAKMIKGVAHVGIGGSWTQQTWEAERSASEQPRHSP